jgi:hypothetical protein
VAGWLLGKLASRRQVAAYAAGVEAGDVLIVADVPESELRQVEDLFRSYGARAITSGVERRAPGDGAAEREPSSGPHAGSEG